MWNEILNQLDYQNTPKKLAAHWGAKSGTLQLISKGINIVYRFENISGFNYLRITHEKLRNKEAVSAAIDFQKHLFTNGAPVCEPVQSLNNRYVEIFAQDENTFIAHVSREALGVMINFEDKDLVIYEKWGKALAQLHLAAQTYNPGKHKFITWHNLHDELQHYANCESMEIRKEFSAISDWLKTLAEDVGNFGLTHGDHRSGNVLYDGDTVYIIDFDEPVYHWFAADIARPFLNPCIEKMNNWREKYLAYLSGYQSYKPIDNKQREMIPWLIRMKILDMYLWTKNNWQNEIAPGGGSTKNGWRCSKKRLKPIWRRRCSKMKSITKFDNLFSFETERLIAKKICGEDLDKLIVLHTDRRIAKTLTGVLTIEQVREKLQQHIDHWEKHGFGLWVFYLKATGEWIGRGGLNQKLLDGKEVVEVAYALRPEFWQQGFATEIASAAIEIAFDILGYTEIYGFVLPENIASQRVMEKVGLAYLRNSTCRDMPCLLYKTLCVNAPRKI